MTDHGADPLGAFSIAAPAGGALGAIHITARSSAAADSTAAALALDPLETGALALRDLGGIDVAVAARPTPTTILLTPHASPIILERLAAWLESAGLARRAEADPRDLYPEATDLAEACALETLARAASPLAIDALLRQPALHRAANRAPFDANLDTTLNRLIHPPLVVAVGHANIGKSTLANTLARRAVAIVADQPGVTRDHVGVTLDLAGLVIRWIDTPGVPQPGDQTTDPLAGAAASLASSVLAAADLVVSCADASAPFLPEDRLPSAPILRVATRADIGNPPPANVTTAASHETGIDTLATAIRDALVPPSSLTSSTPWRFHPRLA